MPIFERRSSRLHSFTSFQKAPDFLGKSPPIPKDKGVAKESSEMPKLVLAEV